MRDRGKPGTYTHAVKMRSALSFGFVKHFNYNASPWQKQADGRNWGNPSLSPIVTTYMKSLRKKKVFLRSNLRILKALDTN